MKLAIITAANFREMPYIDNYIKILNKNNVKFDIYNWNRFELDENINIKGDVYTFCKKMTNRENAIFKLFAYFKFNLFLKKHLIQNKYDKIIVFTPQTILFLYKYLCSNYKNKFILDIRDYSNAKFYYEILEKLIFNSWFTSISSERYKEWLPKYDKYVMCHNIDIEKIRLAEKYIYAGIGEKTLKVATIGSIRDYKANVEIIKQFKNKSNRYLVFNGKGEIEENLKKFVKDNNIENIEFTGSYNRDEEEKHYINADMINAYVTESRSKTSLLNRLYNSIIYGKPLIAKSNTYMADIVSEYNLGVDVDLDKGDDLICVIENFIKIDNINNYNNGRKRFLDKIKTDQQHFTSNVEEFLII